MPKLLEGRVKMLSAGAQVRLSAPMSVRLKSMTVGGSMARSPAPEGSMTMGVTSALSPGVKSAGWRTMTRTASR